MFVSYITCMSNFVIFKVQLVFYFDCSKLVKFNRNLLPRQPIRRGTTTLQCRCMWRGRRKPRQPTVPAWRAFLVSPPCQRGGPAAPLHVVRQSGPAAPRGPVRANGLDLQIKLCSVIFKINLKNRLKLKKRPGVNGSVGVLDRQPTKGSTRSR
jgi:hypothetical protein